MAPANGNLAFQARLPSRAASRSVPDDALELLDSQNTTSLVFVKDCGSNQNFQFRTTK